jgi:pSer/pThr/pTyr-binding forkhead associated (FHA) protein
MHQVPEQAAPDLADETAMASRSPYVQDWSILLDDGRRIALEGLVLLGRNPQPDAGEEDAQLIKIADETRTVSKSHLAVGLDADGVYVVDRGSTNGSTVSTTNGMSARCKAGEMVRVGEGAIISIGDHWLEITRGS